MSELNKIVTNFPMSLSQDENRNLALTLSAVLEGGGGGGVANAIWKPAVDQDGLMTWSWDTFPDSARPPESVNIKGPRGESGAPGRDGTNGTNGTNGENGKTPQIQINSSNAHWEWRYSGASEWTDLGVVASGAVGPQGDPGQKGADGTSVRLVGTETVAGGTQVTLGWGTSETSAFLIPSGAAGTNGQDGYSPSVTTSEIPSSVEHPQGGTSVTITDKTGDHQFDVWNGINGEGASVNLLDGSGIHIEQNGINYTIGVSADYALKSELPDVTDMATKTWVGEQGYLTSVPDTYATKEYANDTSANALSQAQSWVGTQNFLTQADLSGYATETWVGQQGFLKDVPAGYATETYANNASANALAESKSWVNQQHFATSADLATRVLIPDSADVDLKNKYLVLRTKADGTVDGWTDFNDQSYSKSEADGRYVQQAFIGNTLSGTGANANNKLGANTDVIPTKAWMEDNYLPTSGGTVSGQLEVHGGSNFDTQFLKLTREGVTGHARLGLGQYGALALKSDDSSNHTTQVNISPNNSNDQLIQVQHNGNTVGNLIPAQIHQGSYTPTSADGILHIVLES